MHNQPVSFALQEWDRVLNDSRVTISKSSFELKHKWRNEVPGTLRGIVQAENSFLKLRDTLTNAVVTTSYYQVLMRHLVDDHGSPISSISHPKLSWRLSEHILEVAQKDKKLQRSVLTYGENTKELLDYVQYNFEWHYANLSALNAVRATMEDLGDDEDWFPQFYLAMCVWQEDQVRKQTGIPSLFNTEEQSKGQGSIKYWTFKKLVKSGNRFPHREWQQLYGSDLLEASVVVPKKPK